VVGWAACWAAGCPASGGIMYCSGDAFVPLPCGQARRHHLLSPPHVRVRWLGWTDARQTMAHWQLHSCWSWILVTKPAVSGRSAGACPRSATPCTCLPDPSPPHIAWQPVSDSSTVDYYHHALWGSSILSTSTATITSGL
jgi:hypothetical protein